MSMFFYWFGLSVKGNDFYGLVKRTLHYLIFFTHTSHCTTLLVGKFFITSCAASLCLCFANSKLKDFAFNTSLFLGLLVKSVSQTELLLHASVKGTGTPANDSLRVLFSREPANWTTAKSLPSNFRFVPFSVSSTGSSSQRENCSYTSSNSELKCDVMFNWFCGGVLSGEEPVFGAEAVIGRSARFFFAYSGLFVFEFVDPLSFSA